MRRLLTLALLALLTPATPISAASPDHASPDCAKIPSLPAELSEWAARSPVTSSASEGGLTEARLDVGRGADAALHETGDTHYVIPPEKPGEPASHGGLFTLRIPEAGTYRVALGAKAWIDVVSGGKAVASTAHGHGPECSGIRKIVDFPLSPGLYVLQLAGAAEPSIGILVTKRP
ncbi:MAG: homogentisate 1,2-dioxygenase [Sphingomonadales bacterium]